MKTLLKIWRETVYTTEYNVKLLVIKDSTIIETYCHGYDKTTNERKKEFDGYYYTRELKKIV